jgi:hypothetical protein
MKISPIILLTIILASCDSSVRFEVPQPDSKSNEKAIPENLIGEYSSLSDSSTLIVTSGQIIKTAISDIAVLKTEMDSADQVQFKNDTTFSVVNSLLISDITVRGDSLFEHFVFKDTIFSASRGDVLRKFKGYYFLNERTSQNNWHVTRLATTKKGLTLATVSTSEEIKNLRELTETTSDSIYNFNPTRKQFKKFVKMKGFTNEHHYVKIDLTP